MSNAIEITVTPISLRDANAFVDGVHRHHKKVAGAKFAISVKSNDERVRGVVIAGRPVARMLDNGLTLEITRCCTERLGELAGQWGIND